MTTALPYPNDPADPASPEHYPDADTIAEQLMRADFARMHQLRAAVPHARTLAIAELLLNRAAHIRRAWLLTDGLPFTDFQYLTDLVAAWTRNPATMRRHLHHAVYNHAHGLTTLLPIQWRSQYQAAELTGHADDIDPPGPAPAPSTGHQHRRFMTTDIAHPPAHADPDDSPRTTDQLADNLETTASQLTTLAEAAALNSGVVQLDWLRADAIADLAARAAHLLRRNTEGQPRP